MSERGPTYGIELIDSLPIGGGMKQAMPRRRDLTLVAKINGRCAAGYEVLLAAYQAAQVELAEARAIIDKLPKTADGKIPLEPTECWRWFGDTLLQGACCVSVEVLFPDPGSDNMLSPNDGIESCCSTREAAERAAEGND